MTNPNTQNDGPSVEMTDVVMEVSGSEMCCCAG